MTGELVEGGKEMFGNEKGFVREGKRMEIVESEEEGGGRGEERGETVVMIERLRKDGVGKI